MPENREIGEVRRSKIAPVIQSREGGAEVITGYGAVFYDASNPGTEYWLWPDMVERIRRGAFDRAAREDDVRGLLNHDSNKVLGRTKSGTLRLTIDAAGLKYEIDPPDTQDGRDAMALLKRGDIDGSSFQFQANKTTWEENRKADGSMFYVRWIEDVKLYDVGPVTFPAYSSATSGVRAEGREESIRRECEAWKAARVMAAAADQDAIAAAAAKMLVIENDG